MTTRLVEDGKQLGISVLDHIIIGGEGKYFSFGDEGLLQQGPLANVHQDGVKSGRWQHFLGTFLGQARGYVSS